MRALVIAIVLPLLLTSAGCGKDLACKKDTAFLTIDLGGDALAADRIDVDVSVGAGAARSGSFAHTPGQATASIEVDFSTYSAGQTITVAARASTGGTIVGATTQALTLTSGCTSAHLSLSTGGGGDDLGGDDGGGSAVLTADRTSIDYGSVVANTMSAPVAVTVRNDGSGASGALTVALGGADAGSYAIATDGCSGQTLDAGASCTVAVRLQATAAGTPMAMLTIAGAPGGSVSVSLAGTVLAAGALAFTPTSNDFSMVTVGATATSTFTLKNTGGSATGTLSAATLGGSDAGQFSIANDGCSAQTLPANGSCTIDVKFAPTTAGGKVASLSISATPGGGAAASLSGTGRLLRTLVVNVAQIDGSSGTVSSSPAGITSCATAGCSASFTDGSMVTLTATPGVGYYFQGWTGDCSGTAPTCMVPMTAARTVGATFTPPNHVFVTSATFTLTSLTGTTLSSIATKADAACTTAANGHFTGPFVAWVSTASTSALSRLGSARGWVRGDGKPVFDTTAAMATRQMFYPVLYDETGAAIATGSSVLTGTKDTGVADSDNCANWTDRANGHFFTLGLARANVSDWTYTNLAGDCDTDTNMFHLYCFGTKYNAPITVPPATGRLAFVSKGGFDTSTGFAGAKTICTNEAAASAKTMGHTFLPLLARPTTSAASNFSAAGNPWVRVDGIPIAATPNDLIGATPNLLASIGVTADGTYLGDYVWTGGNGPTTTSNSQTCSDWSTKLNTGVGMSGSSGRTDNQYFTVQAFNCTPPAYHVYCLEP